MYKDEELDGLKDKPRSGRPPLVDKDLIMKIRKQLEDSTTGWDFRQVVDIIQKRASIKYHEVHIYRLLYKLGFAPKVPQKRFIRTTATMQEKRKFKKEYKRP
jgi:putative transposase